MSFNNLWVFTIVYGAILSLSDMTIYYFELFLLLSGRMNSFKSGLFFISSNALADSSNKNQSPSIWSFHCKESPKQQMVGWIFLGCFCLSSKALLNFLQSIWSVLNIVVCQGVENHNPNALYRSFLHALRLMSRINHFWWNL